MIRAAVFKGSGSERLQLPPCSMSGPDILSLHNPAHAGQPGPAVAKRKRKTNFGSRRRSAGGPALALAVVPPPT